MDNLYWIIPALAVAFGAGLGGVALAWTLGDFIPQWINRVSQTHRVLRRFLLTLYIAFCATVVICLWFAFNILWKASVQ